MVNPYKRQFLISWISVLASVPDIDMLQYLPELLEGLMGMLSDTNREIRQATGKALQVCPFGSLHNSTYSLLHVQSMHSQLVTASGFKQMACCSAMLATWYPVMLTARLHVIMTTAEVD